MWCIACDTWVESHATQFVSHAIPNSYEVQLQKWGRAVSHAIRGLSRMWCTLYRMRYLILTRFNYRSEEELYRMRYVSLYRMRYNLYHMRYPFLQSSFSDVRECCIVTCDTVFPRVSHVIRYPVSHAIHFVSLAIPIFSKFIYRREEWGRVVSHAMSESVSHEKHIVSHVISNSRQVVSQYCITCVTCHVSHATHRVSYATSCIACATSCIVCDTAYVTLAMILYSAFRHRVSVSVLRVGLVCVH